MMTSIPCLHSWPSHLQRRVAREKRHHREAATQPTGHRCVRAQARKGFGVSLPRLPSLGGKNKVPSGGVAPAPPIDLSIPADIERQWADARQQWTRHIIDHPVLLPALDARVHLVPVGADLPGDAALIRDVVAAVGPDAIALESPPQHLKSYTSLAKALEPLLAHLLAADLRSPTAARTCLSQPQREELQTGLLQACRSASFKPEPDQLTHLFRLGGLPFVEWLVPAHLVRTDSAGGSAPKGRSGVSAQPSPQQQPMLLLSCGLDRAARAALPAEGLFLGREFDLYLEEVEAALGEELGAELAAWRTALGDLLEAAGAGRELATLLAAWEAQSCLGPQQQREVAAQVEARMLQEARERQAGGSGGGEGEGPALEVVRNPADPLVARRLAELAAGKDVVRKCRCIVAVVGRIHAGSVEEELKKLAAGG